MQNLSGITTRQGQLFPGAEPGPQFYPVSAIDYLTGYLMAFGAMVALARRAKQGGSWLVRISLAQTGRWLVARGEVPEAALKDAQKEISQADIERWSTDSDTPVGRLQHLGPTVRLSNTCPIGPDPRSRSATMNQPGPPPPGEGRSAEFRGPGADVLGAVVSCRCCPAPSIPPEIYSGPTRQLLKASTWPLSVVMTVMSSPSGAMNNSWVAPTANTLRIPVQSALTV